MLNSYLLLFHFNIILRFLSGYPAWRFVRFPRSLEAQNVGLEEILYSEEVYRYLISRPLPLFFSSVFWIRIRIRIGSGVNQVSGFRFDSGSGSRRIKITHKNRKKLWNFMVWSDGNFFKFLVINTLNSGSVFSLKCWILIRIRNQWIRIRNTAFLKKPDSGFILSIKLDPDPPLMRDFMV